MRETATYERTELVSTSEALRAFRSALEEGVDWPTALLQAIAEWFTPEETVGDRVYRYFIEGEAFDWLLLAERLFEAADVLIPDEDKEALLFQGRFPDYFENSRFKELIGIEKYRGYLNYFYGVTVEEALQLASEKEVHKRQLSNGNQYQNDFSEEALSRIYRESPCVLVLQFREDKGYPDDGELTMEQSTEFNYWLFKNRMKTSDKAKVASDTRKGLKQLHEMMASDKVGMMVP